MAKWLTQWGSKALGDQGYSPSEILRYYYGDDIYINTAEEISGIPSSWPGYTLSQGSSGTKVRQMQEQLNVIAGAYPAIPKITVDGIYGPATASSVRTILQFWIHLHKFRKFYTMYGNQQFRLPEARTPTGILYYDLSFLPKSAFMQGIPNVSCFSLKCFILIWCRLLQNKKC